MAEVVGEGARRSRTWAVTDAGRAELRRWLIETEPNRAQRNETRLRWFLVYLLEPEDRRAVLERELAFVAAAAERRAGRRRVDAQARRHRSARVDLGQRVDPVMRTGCASRSRRPSQTRLRLPPRRAAAGP